MNNKLLILIILILVVALGYCLYLIQTQKQMPEEKLPPLQTATTTSQIEKPVTQTESKKNCVALHVTSPLPNTVVSFPVTITGTIDKSNGCKWGVFEGVAGVVELAFLNGSTWHTISRMNQITVEDWTQPVTHFTATIDFDNGSVGLSKGQQLKFIFRSENPSGLPENDITTELPLTFDVVQTGSSAH